MSLGLQVYKAWLCDTALLARECTQCVVNERPGQEEQQRYCSHYNTKTQHLHAKSSLVLALHVVPTDSANVGLQYSYTAYMKSLRHWQVSFAGLYLYKQTENFRVSNRLWLHVKGLRCTTLLLFLCCSECPTSTIMLCPA